jgi:hypothetical protein
VANINWDLAESEAAKENAEEAAQIAKAKAYTNTPDYKAKAAAAKAAAEAELDEGGMAA